jgi:hypothetical protein
MIPAARIEGGDTLYGMLSLVTTTRNRPFSFSLVEEWIARQSYREPWQWLVVNDGTEPYEYRMGQDGWERTPEPTMRTASGKIVPEISIVANWLEAIPLIEGDKVVVVEDDDWLHPNYLEMMDRELDEADLVGISFDLYWKVRDRKYKRMGNAYHASLGATAFRSYVLPAVKRCCNVLCAKNNSVFLDMYLWAEAEPMHGLRTRLIQNKAPDGRAYHVGLKQMPGAPGLGLGHSDDGAADPQGTMLAEWIGQQDARAIKAIRFRSGDDETV